MAGRTFSPMEFYGVRIVGLHGETLRKLVLTFAIIALMLLVRWAFGFVAGLGSKLSLKTIWARKGIRLAVGATGLVLIMSVWFDSPQRLATFTGLLAAGAAFASQNAILSIAGYFVIVFGKVFNIGDRIEVGEVRGDVLDIGLFKTTVMEMGVPSALIPHPNHWIGGRQYSGRVVTFTNAEIFKQPTFNYTSTFDFAWDEIRLPLKFDVELDRAEQIVLEATARATADVVEGARQQYGELRHKYLINAAELQPQTFVRISDSWVELSVRFLTRAHGVRKLKDRICRELLVRFREAGIEIATTTYEVVGTPRVKLELGDARESPSRAH